MNGHVDRQEELRVRVALLLAANCRVYFYSTPFKVLGHLISYLLPF